ncbi:uncharacterized protein B0I36DRAFT_354457 [Microdochium trichocladiopsis]|uniref:Uncharacterized protein n=1 Tax=Microdochium trichocladiopsis TaxID=1682393 RepID=A0A9P9BJJ1_9PEZI|nr:uncharacterized protein B0I36DRAFT_354457 [Microdochium trichocladiopsis]KAH7018150.1 hypothetical protein B0I36DRAFT_354457 [Microdochium trichocladiopsis]
MYNLKSQLEAAACKIWWGTSKRVRISGAGNVHSIYMKRRRGRDDEELVALGNDTAMEHLIKAHRDGSLKGIEVLFTGGRTARKSSWRLGSLSQAALEDYNFSGHSPEPAHRASVFSIAILWDIRWPTDLDRVSLNTLPDEQCMDQIVGGASRGAMDVLEVKYTITG